MKASLLRGQTCKSVTASGVRVSQALDARPALQGLGTCKPASAGSDRKPGVQEQQLPSSQPRGAEGGPAVGCCSRPSSDLSRREDRVSAHLVFWGSFEIWCIFCRVPFALISPCFLQFLSLLAVSFSLWLFPCWSESVGPILLCSCKPPPGLPHVSPSHFHSALTKRGCKKKKNHLIGR